MSGTIWLGTLATKTSWLLEVVQLQMSPPMESRQGYKKNKESGFLCEISWILNVAN